jgi:urease accessory protein
MESPALRLMAQVHWRSIVLTTAALTLALSLSPAAAWAHADAHPGGGFVAGFLHPISGAGSRPPPG